LRVVIAAAVAATLALTGAVAASAPMLLADPEEPGANLPPAGRSLFDELFEISPPGKPRPEARYDLPFPFERLLDQLNARIAPAKAITVLIPLGRSLQRFAADPDYFDSPRVVVAITEDHDASDRARLKDRLYVGYQERADEIEVISYNESAGRFEFQLVDYRAGSVPRVEYAERFICVGCHQGHGPIFPTAVWNETNADPEVAARLAGLGGSFHGAPTGGGVDRADAFDRSTDRAAKLPFTNALWEIGCGEPDEPAAAQCRGELLLAALRYRLGGERAPWRADDVQGAALAERLAGRLNQAAPAGLGAPSPDLPNRTPLAEIEAGVALDVAVDPDGIFEPSLRREPIVFWRPSDLPSELLATGVGDIAAEFADADIRWLDACLAALASPDAEKVTHGLSRCRTREIARGADRREIRLACGDGATAERATALAGYVTLEGDAPTGGLMNSLTLDGQPPLSRLIVAGGARLQDARGDALELSLREAGVGLTARLPGGERLTPVILRLTDDGAAELELGVVDDLAPLRGALSRMAEAATVHPIAALGAGPLRRRAVLAELSATLSDGTATSQPEMSVGQDTLAFSVQSRDECRIVSQH
jgi:hypothetical protein